MSSLDCMDFRKIVVKTEPVDNFEEENFHDLSLGKSKFKSLQQHYKEVILGTECKNEIMEDNFQRNNHNVSETTEKMRKIKQSQSHSDDSNTNQNALVDQFPIVTDVKRSNSPKETVSHSQYSDFLYSPDSPKSEESDYKPSQEDLEIYYRVSSKLNLIQSLCRSENRSDSNHDFNQIKGDDACCRTHGFIQDSSDLNSVTPSVTISSLSHTQLADTALRRYATHLSSEKEDTCNKRFLDSEIMKAVVNKDGSLTYYQCRFCNKVFMKKPTLRQHFITHTGRFSCPSCATCCKSKGDLMRHIQTHTKEKPYHCDVCDTNYTRESILKKHMQTQLHLKAFSEHENHMHLQNSGKSVPTFVTTQTKLKLVFPCNLCPKVTFSKCEYMKHSRSHALKYICNICYKGCKSLVLLKIHKRSHKKTSSLSCKLCSRSFVNFYCLKEHIKSHRSVNSSKITEQILSKDHTSKQKNTRDSVKIRFHSQQIGKVASKLIDSVTSFVTEIECDKCHKIFATKRLLAKHKCVHDDIYICNVCSMTFHNLFKLKVHLKLHERIIKCDICEITFISDKELQDHVGKLHHGGNDYTCKLCYDHFERDSDLKSHMNNHNPTMLFSGRSLDESTVPMGSKATKKHVVSVNDTIKGTTTETLSDSGEGKVSNKSEKMYTCKSNDSDDDSILDSQEFFEILNKSVDGSDDILNDSEVSDSDEELYSGIKTILENEVLSSKGSVTNGFKATTLLQKPLVYGHLDIVKKHCAEFERYSERNVSNQSFKCKMCDIIFYKEKYLINHLKHHVCEFCNIFFIDKEKLYTHKSHHVTQLLKQIKTEYKRLHIPKQKWRGYLMVSSESENDLEDQNINVTKIILEKDFSGAVKTANLKHTLSHDEIVQVNKHLFEQFSCLVPEKNIFACTICKRKYARPTTLTRHLKTHVCQFCNKFFKDKSDLLEHKYSHHKKSEVNGGNIKISSSNRVSKPNRELFKKYSYVDVDRNVFRCTLCHKGFVRRTVLTRHLKTHICSHCDQFFENKYDLVKHIATLHQGEKQHLDINDSFENNDDEKQCLASPVVVNVDHGVKNVTPLSLPHTSSFSRAQPTRSSRNKRVTFVQIPNTTTSETVNTKQVTDPAMKSLSLQIIPHSVQVPHESFANASKSYDGNGCAPNKLITKIQHKIMTSFTKERDRPFQCCVCLKRFLKNDHLKSHMTIHTGERPFICFMCNKAFGRSTILQKHMKTHVKICKICDASFNYKHELNLHKKIHKTHTFNK